MGFLCSSAHQLHGMCSHQGWSHCFTSPPHPCLTQGTDSIGDLLGCLHHAFFPSLGPFGQKLGSGLPLRSSSQHCPTGQTSFLALPARCLGFPISLSSRLPGDARIILSTHFPWLLTHRQDFQAPKVRLPPEILLQRGKSRWKCSNRLKRNAPGATAAL